MLTATIINNQKSIKIKYPIGTIITFSNKDKDFFWAITGIQLFPTKYEILESSASSIERNFSLDPISLDNLQSTFKSIKIPPIYSSEDNKRNYFYFIPKEHLNEIKNYLSSCDSSCKTKYKKFPKDSAKLYEIKKIDDNEYFKFVHDILTQFQNGIIVSAFDNYEKSILDKIKKFEQSKLFRKRFNDILEKTNINLNLLAEETKIHLWVIKGLLNGTMHPGAQTAYKLSTYFGVSPDYLIGKSDNENPISFSQNNNQKSKILLPTGQIQNLTTKEMQLLENFKLLCPTARIQLLDYIDYLVKKDKSKTQYS